MRSVGIFGRCTAWSFVAFALLSTAATARETPATEAEKKEATLAYVACQRGKAERLDDGRSDAMTVGRSVAASCRPEMEQVAAVLAKGEKRDRVRLMLIDRLASHAAEDAISVVLLQRKRQSGEMDEAPRIVSDRPSDVQAVYDPTSSKLAAAREQLMTGSHLKEACQIGADEWSKCSAFVRGVMDAYRAGILREGGKPPYCPSEPYFAFQWTRDVADFLNSHSDFSEMPAESAVIFALEEKYPCKSK